VCTGKDEVRCERMRNRKGRGGMKRRTNGEYRYYLKMKLISSLNGMDRAHTKGSEDNERQ
jgi:hypothetical protein